MTSMTQSQTVRSDEIIQLPDRVDGDSAPYQLAGRIIQITLAVYLLPALLVVLMVGGLGILVMRIGRVLTDLFDRPGG